jgi:hypothetical protein
VLSVEGLDKKKLPLWALIAIIAGSVVGFLIIVAVAWFLLR